MWIVQWFTIVGPWEFWACGRSSQPFKNNPETGCQQFMLITDLVPDLLMTTWVPWNPPHPPTQHAIPQEIKDVGEWLGSKHGADSFNQVSTRAVRYPTVTYGRKINPLREAEWLGQFQTSLCHLWVIPGQSQYCSQIFAANWLMWEESVTKIKNYSNVPVLEDD